MAKGQADQQIAYAARAEEALKMAQEKIEVIEPDQDLTDALHAFQSSYIKALPAKSMSDRGLADPSPLLAEYTQLDTKCHYLLGTIERNSEERRVGRECVR